jgi:metal-responsive CopG/Arc/MetJ family transcriptional regulator
MNTSSASRHKGRKEKKVSAPSARVSGSRKVVIDFPEPLFENTERAAEELAVNRSALIRNAVAEYLEALRRRRLDEELAAGYLANAELDRRIGAEFASVDDETF